MQFQSDILGIPLYQPKIRETTALGAAYLAGLAVGFWKDLDEIRTHWTLDSRYEPQMDPQAAAGYVEKWHKAVECTKLF